MKKEFRSLQGIEIRAASEGSPFIATLAGYAAVFDSESQPIMNEERGRMFIEKIARGAFSETLAENRERGTEILSLWDHDTSRPLGRRGANLRVSEDEKGLRFELDVPNTSIGRDLVENVRAGVVFGASFAFSAKKQSVIRGADFDLRTLHKVNLYEVSPTAIPAYAGSSIDFRSHSKLCEQPAEVRSIVLGDGDVESVEKEERKELSNTEDTRETRLRIICK